MADTDDPDRIALEPGLVRLRAPNPSPMTERGTNSYLLGEDALCIIDPGPDMAGHLAALLAEIGGRPVEAIIVTHAHRDHSALAPALARQVGAPILAFGDAQSGRSAAMRRLAGRIGGGEGVDAAFTPDRTLQDGASLEGPGWRLEALHTPGHMGNHLCLEWNGCLFTGDLVMGWASTLVSPPDGDVSQFVASCERLRARAARRLFPGHGAPIDDAAARIDWLIAHRRDRERQILAALRAGTADAGALTRALYSDVAPSLHPAAMRNVIAHLVDLENRNLVASDDADPLRASFSLT
ncbi:MBL fold metallo-hydrolase [Limimaricola pyoseonensis]|uniref:Hydroxyacylglutathione hydrolase n=1 Tax=Limimaricola pyoseonensis TaxID=521013 RepID=A0A1G7AI05_9RHOB|nr:MBL fold metallo-hydrolase [Limimaricola pyoseonensis]SDE14429.1 hydroxyacylglutathione hydrolase [Limimaricola pyoseonensis]